MLYVSKDSKCIPWATSLEQVSYKDVLTRTPAGRAQDYLQLRAASKRPQTILFTTSNCCFNDYEWMLSGRPAHTRTSMGPLQGPFHDLKLLLQ